MKTSAPQHFYKKYLIMNEIEKFPEILMEKLYCYLT